MTNILQWIFYYLKCAFNLAYSYFASINIKKPKINIVNKYFYKVELNGTYYEMGLQYGMVMKNVLYKDINVSKKFIKENNDIFLKKIPYQFIKNKCIFDSIINLFKINEKYYNKDIINFMKGVSESSKIDFNDLLYVNLFSDLTDNHCILLSKKIDDKVFNLRTLDYGCLQLSQSLIIFNPTNKNKYISLNISIQFGLFTGISEKGIFFGESYYDFKIGNLSLLGMPFHHISHKILSECNNVVEAEKLLDKCNRTSNLQLMISDNESSKIYLSCQDKFIIQQEGYLVYSVTPNEKKNFDENFNYLDSLDNIIKKFIPKTKSGELHVMITYNNKLYVSVTTDILQSYNNTFYEFNLDELFNIKM